MNINEKLQMARMLEALHVDVIEAGFAACSQGDFSAVKLIADEVKNAQVASLCRCVENDCDIAWNALKGAEKPLLHVFIATSDMHLAYKLKMSREQVLESVAGTVSYAKRLCGNVEFSAEDATRSDREFLRDVLNTALKNGANVVNMADTVGYIQPGEIIDLVSFMKNSLDAKNGYKLSVHCHNDLGLATSNTLAAISAGADRVDLTVNGIGERAGNASLEEVVMALKTRGDIYNAETAVDTRLLIPASKKLTMITGIKVQPNKAIVGANAFAHESGIHQHGVMEKRETYEIINPEDVGYGANKIIMGKHSGRHALEEKIQALGYGKLSDTQLDALFEKFKLLAESKKTVSDRDIEALIRINALNIGEIYKLDKYIINSGNVLSNTCNIRIIRDGDKVLDGFATGEGPIDAAYNAINDAVKLDAKLLDYIIESVTGGADAQGAVSVKLSCNGKTYKGYGVNVNIFEASIAAYLNALNSMAGE